MITFFPNTPQLLCPIGLWHPIRLLLGFIRGGCMTALDKQTPVYCSKFINLKTLKASTLDSSEMRNAINTYGCSQ